MERSEPGAPQIHFVLSIKNRQLSNIELFTQNSLFAQVNHQKSLFPENRFYILARIHILLS